MTKALKTYYDVLGLHPSSCNDEIVRSQFVKLARRYHPDYTTLHDKAKAQRMFQLVHKAYMHLKTRPQRLAYNAYLKKTSVTTNEDSPSFLRKAFEILTELFWPLRPTAD